MADTRVTIDVDLNTSPAAQGLRNLQRQYNAFSSALNRNNAAQATAARQYSDQLMNLVNSSQYFTAETVRMRTAAGQLDQTLKKGQVTMGQFFSARFLRDSTAAAQVLSLANARAAALQTQFFATSAAANGMRDAIAVRPYAAFNDALAVSAQKLAIHRAMLMQATTQMINFGKNTQWAGRQLMVGFTVPLTIFGGVAGKVFRELEEQAINFKKVYGDIFTTEEETEKALDAVRELSVEFTKYGIAVKDTMALAGVAAQSGLQNAELMAATTQATRLATLGQMEQADAMKTIISLQTAFKTSNEGLAESVDFLNIIENQTVLSLQDVAGAIPRVAPVIQGLGGDVKDLAVLLVAMKEGGVTAGEGANALKSSLGRLIVPTKQAKEMAAEFGISLEQIVENNRGQLLPMIMELGQALNTVGDLEKQQLLSTIFGKFQYARIGALFDSITRDSSQAARAMQLMNLSAAELGQIAEKELGVVEESVGARFTAAMEKAKVAIAPLGEAFLNLSIPLINMFAKIVEKFNELPDFAKKFAVFGSVIVGVVIPVGTMFLGLLMNLIGTLIKFGSVIGIAFKGFTSGGIKGAIDAVSQAMNYMSLEEIDASIAARQLGESTVFVNEALRQQVPRSAEATTAINQLGGAYGALVARMREAAALSATAGGAFVVPGAAADAARRRGPRPQGLNKGGTVNYFNNGNKVPGTGNTDTVPAMLTPGEFVVNKQATADNLDILTAINDGNNVQYKNKGGGIATPGRMYYGPLPGRRPAPPVMSDEDFVAQAMKGPTELERRAAAQAQEVGIGRSSVRLPSQAGRIASQRRYDDLVRRLNERYPDDNVTIRTKDVERLFEGEDNLSSRTIRDWAKENGLPKENPSSATSTRKWNKNQVLALLNEKVKDDIQKAHFGTRTATLADIPRIPNATARDEFGKELIRAGLPVLLMTDDWAKMSAQLNQAANRSNRQVMTVAEAIENISNYKGMITLGPAMRRAGVDKDKFVDDVAEYLSTNYGSNARFTDDMLTQARDAVVPRTVSANVTGIRIPSLEDLSPWATRTLGRDISPRDIDGIDQALQRVGYKIVRPSDSGLDKTAIAPINWTRGSNVPIERIGDSSAYNAGGLVIPGIPGYMAGARINPLFKEMERRRAGIAVAKGKSIDDIIFARGADKKLNASAFDLLTLLKHNPNLTRKELERIQKYHGKRIRDGVFGRFDPQFGVRFKDSDSPQWRDVAKLLEEKGFPVIQKRNDGGEIFESGGRTIVPGVGNTDTVPALLTPGEFVINKQATQANKPLLQAINAGQQLNVGGRVKGVQFLNAGNPVLSSVSGGVPATDHVYGYDRNKKPITNWQTAANMAFINKLFDADGKRIPPSAVRMVHRGTPPAAAATSLIKKFGMTRAQKIWAIISALTMAGTATGITLNERNENKKEQQGLRFNTGGKVPAMLTPGEFIVNKNSAESNLGLLHAINGGQIPGYALGGAVGAVAKFAIPMGLSIPAGMAGAQAGEAVGGDTGSMIGGMTGGMLPFLLAGLPFGKMFGRGKAAAAGSQTTMLANTTAGAKAASEGIKQTTKSTAAVAMQFTKLARIIPLIFNPWTALAAAAVAVGYTLYKMNESNKAEYEAGRRLADAMSTSADEISALGTSAKQRAQDISSYLNQSESSFIEQKYNKKIAKAKTEREKLALKEEKKEAMERAGGEKTRRSTVRAFYDARISELASAGAADQERQNIYAQRNAALAAQRLSGINLDPKFGKQFIEGAGKEVFDEFKAMRRLGMQGGANFEYAQEMARAAYGATVSVTEASARDLGAKLSQYILSGVMTEDEASSVAAAIGQELKDARIGQTIRNEVLSTVGADGLRAQYDPASVAMKLVERDERKLAETRDSLFTLMNKFGGAGTSTGEGIVATGLGGLVIGQGIKDIVSANRKNNQQMQMPIAQQKELLLPSFFMGDADEMRRQMGAMIELQVSQMEMLEENIAAVGLAYNDMILKADTLTKKKDLEMEKSLAISRLQEKQDAAREQQFAMFGGSEEWAKQAREQIEAAAFSFSNKFDAYTNSQIQDLGEAMALPVNWSDISAFGTNLVNTGKQAWEALDAVTTQLTNWGANTLKNVSQNLEDTIFDPTGGATFGKMYGEQTLEAVRKKYEGSAAGAALETFLQQPIIKDLQKSAPETLMALTQNMLIMGEEYSNAVMGSSMAILGAIEFASSNVDEAGRPLLDSRMETGLEARVSQLTAGLTISGNQMLSPEGLMEITTLMGSMADDLRQGGDDLLKTFDLLETHPMFTGEQAEIATERWANFVNQTRELTEIALEDGRTLYDELIEDQQFVELVLTDDQFFKDYLKFTKWLNKQGEDTKIAIRTEITNADDATKVVQDLVGYLANFDPATANKKFKNFIDQFSNLEMGEEFEKEIARITRALKRLDKIKDPEIKAKLLAEIDPNIDLLIRLMNQLSADPGNVELQNQLLDVAQDLNATGRAAAAEGETKEKPKGGSGSAGEDPLNALMRQLRDTTDQLASIGMEMLSVGRESKSIFAKLRDQGVNEVVIDYLRSMSPEEAIKAGQDLLKNEKKLNTIMQQAGEAAIARQQDARMVAEARAKFAGELLRSGKDKTGVKALSGAPLLDMEQALNDPKFMEMMMAARGTAKPNKAMRQAQQEYFGELEAQRRIMFNMAPAVVQSQAQQNLAQTYAANQLRAQGLSQEEIDTALQSEEIMNRIRGRLEKGKAIGPVIVEMTKDLYASTRTAMDILDEGISKVGNVFDFLSESLNNAIQQIDRFTIKPLQDDLEEIQESNAEMSETQRRLSRSLTLLQKTEADTRERQKEDEEKINESYDLRIEALEKVDKINKDIEDRQQGQITVADALSRGDIGAAARAAQEMQAKAAQSRREEALQAMRDKKEEDMDNLKKAHEEELKNLTIDVNGELLTREQIQGRIDDLETKIYDNSLKEYGIQQKINDALKERAKIEEQAERLGIARSALEQLSAINQETDVSKRGQLVEQAKRTVQLIGGPEAEKLIQVIDTNMQGLLSATGSTDFISAMQNVQGEFGSFLGTSATNIQALNINIPGIQSALDTAVTTATTALPEIFTGIRDQIDKLNKEIAVDPESDDNPFAKVYKAAKKVAAKIEAAFANIKPPPGTGGPGDKPKDGPGTTEAETDEQLPTAVLRNVTARKDLRSKSDTITLADGRKARVTNYYDSDGKLVPALTKYEITQTVGRPGAPDRAFTGKEYESRKDFITAGGTQFGQGIEMNLPYSIGHSRGVPMRPVPERNQGNFFQRLFTVDNLKAFASGGGFIPPIGTVLGIKSVFDNMQATDRFGKEGFSQAGSEADKESTVRDVAKKLGEETGKEIGDDVVRGVAKGIIEGSIAYNEGAIREALLKMMKNEVQANSPAESMVPIGEYIVLGVFKGILMKIKNAPGEILNNFISGIKTIFGIEGEEGSTNGRVTGVGGSISRGILEGLKLAIKFTPFGIIGNLVSGLLGLFGIAEGEEAGATNGRVTGVGTGLAKGIFSGLLEAAKKSPVGLLMNVAGSIARALGISVGEDGTPGEKSTNSSIVGIGKSVISGVFQGVLNWFNTTSVGEFVTDLLDKAQKMLENAFTKNNGFIGAMKAIGSGIWNSIKQGLSDAIGTVGEFAQEARRRVGLANLGGEIKQDGTVKRAFGGMISYRGSREPAPGMMMGGKVKKYAFGSFVPGRGMTDKVPALLTPGEFVVRKSVAQQMMPQLKAMNSQVFPGMGVPQKRSFSVSSPQFSTGRNLSADSIRFGVPQNVNSYVYPSTNFAVTQTNMESNPITNATGPTNVQYNYNLKVSAKTNASAQEIADTVMYKIRRFDDRRIKGTEIG